MSVGVSMRLFDMFLEKDLDISLRIVRAKEEMGEVAATLVDRDWGWSAQAKT